MKQENIDDILDAARRYAEARRYDEQCYNVWLDAWSTTSSQAQTTSHEDWQASKKLVELAAEQLHAAACAAFAK